MASNNDAVINRGRTSYRSVWSAFAGWGISTLLLWLLNRNKDGDSSSQDPSKYTDGNANQIGSVVPVVMGRAMIKNPLVSYYGDFQYRAYTEEYGMHTKFPWASVITTIVLGIIAMASTPDEVVGTVQAGPYTGTTVKVNTVDSGLKRAAILNIIVAVLLEILTWLFTRHMGRITIQKGFKYYLGWQHIICWTGDNIGLKKIWMNVYDSEVEESTNTGVWDNNSNIAWKKYNPNGIVARIDNEEMFGGVDSNGGFVGDIRIYFGTDVQPLDSWMVDQMTNSSNIPQELRGLTPQYPMYLTCVIPTAYIGRQATIPSMWFEVVNYPSRLGEMFGKDIDSWSRLKDDSNPAEVIYEILKNDYWGCDYPDTRIDLDSLEELGDTCYDEGLGISCHINSVDKVSSYINKILDHIHGTCYDDPKTGKLTFKLIRNNYDIDSIKHFKESNCSHMEFTRLDWLETSNSLAVSFTFADEDAKYDTGTVTVYDLANIKMTHNIKEINADGMYFTTKDNARSFAKSQLVTAAYPLSTINFEASRYAYDLTLGEPILVTWKPYSIDKQVFRVTDIDYGTLTNGKIAVTAVEDVFGFEKTEYGAIGDIGWEEDDPEPSRVSFYTYLEYPYEMIRSLDTYIHAYAARPDEQTIRWYVYRYVNGNYVASASSSKWSVVGRLYYTLDESYEDSQSGFTVSSVGYDSYNDFLELEDLINSNPTYYNNLSGQNLCIIDDEIISFDKLVTADNGYCNLRGVIRGVFDTLPKRHTANSFVYMINTGISTTYTTYICPQGQISAEQFELVTATIANTDSFNPNYIDSYTTVRRSERPSVMGNLEFGCDRGTETVYSHNYPATELFSGNIVFRFNSRNKFNAFSILHQYDDSVIVEETTVNAVNIDCIGISKEYTYTAYDNYNVIDNFTFKWSDFCNQMGSNLQDTNIVDLEIYTKNTSNELTSYDKYIKQIVYNVPILLGIVASVNDILPYVAGLITSDFLTLPQSNVNPSKVIYYNFCPLVFVGTQSNSANSVLNQDGSRFDISNNVCYRVDGENNGVPIITRLDIDDEFVFSSIFTPTASGEITYKYLGNQVGWDTFTLAT